MSLLDEWMTKVDYFSSIIHYVPTFKVIDAGLFATMEKNKTQMTDGIEDTRYGPEIVGPNEDGIKLYNFCKQHMHTNFTKRQLRDYFMNAYVVLNGVPVRAGHEDETKRLAVGDKVEIILNLTMLEQKKLDSYQIDILFQCEEYCVINKPSGLSVAPGKPYEIAVKKLLWNSERVDICSFLYCLEKGLNGLCIVAKSFPHYKQLREMLVNGIVSVASRADSESDRAPLKPSVTLTYQAVICGSVGDEGADVQILTGFPECPLLHIHVVKVCRCRSANFVSLVNITPHFDAVEMGVATDLSLYNVFSSEADRHVDKSGMNSESFVRTLTDPVTNADYMMLNHPTRLLKHVRNSLMRAGHAVVGHGDMVKKSKGVYAALIAIQFCNMVGSADGSGSGSFTVEIPSPAKFVKVMEREHRMWHAANDRDQLVLQEHLSRTGGSAGEDAASDDEEQEVGAGADCSDSSEDDAQQRAKQTQARGNKRLNACGVRDWRVHLLWALVRRLARSHDSP